MTQDQVKRGVLDSWIENEFTWEVWDQNGWLWCCESCQLYVISDPPGATDWPDGILRPCPVDCPMCECPMEFEEEDGSKHQHHRTLE